VPRFVRVDILESRWYTADLPWLGQGAVPASALIDLRAKDNTLSLFEVSEHIDPERIVVAVAVGKQSADDIGYAIFDGDPAASGIQITKVPGTTPDMAVNALHRDLQQLTAQNIADLAALIGSGETRTMLRGRLLALVDAGAAAGHLDRAKLKQKWAINAAGHR
jgi:hypothetical protein